MSAIVDFPVKAEARPYLDAFAAVPGEPGWLAGRRRRDLARFAELGFPSRRSEAWRYLDLRTLEQPLLPGRGPPVDITTIKLADLTLAGAAQRIVLVDGRFAPGLSSVVAEPGVWLGSMAAALAERPDLVRAALDREPVGAARPFDALNAAFFADGFVLDVAAGTRCDRPIEILHVSSGASEASLHTRSLVSLAAGSHAAIAETFAHRGEGSGRYWRNDIVEIRLAEGAALTRTVLVDEADAALHLGQAAVSLDKNARFASFALLLGGRALRQEVEVRVIGENAFCQLDGAFLIGGRQQANIVATVDHAAPRGQTRELVKGVAAGRAQGAFQGKIIVREGAQKVDAQQTSRNLLLGSHAVIDTKPELEIYADDVKCAHGATVGDLDEAALFYLLARGIPPDEARRMLIEAFVHDALERIEMPAVREHLMRRLAQRLGELEN